MNRAMLIAAALALSACGEAPPTRQPSTMAGGERFIIRLQTIAEMKPVTATLTTRDVAEARSRVGGTLVRLLVREGDLVRRGQMIALVRDDRTGLQTQAYDAQVASAQAEQARAAADLARTEDLYDHGVYAKARLDQVRAAAGAAQGALTAARALRAASAETDAQGAVLAPADGRVLRADIPAGSVVSPGQSLATLTAGPVVVRLEIPEAQGLSLKTGQTVEFASDDLGLASTQARVTQVYPAVTGGLVTADLEAPGLQTDFIGRRLVARLRVGSRNALIAPSRFMVSRYGVDYVRVLGPKGAADVPVQLAPGPDAGAVEILSGLSPGDTLLVPGPRP